MTDDKIAAELAPIMEREQAALRGPWVLDASYGRDPVTGRITLDAVAGPWTQEDLEFIAHARQDVPRLLAAVEVALRHHRRLPLYGNASTEGEPGNCPHHPDSDLHFEDSDGSGEWLCEGKPEGAVCESCVDGEGGERVEWPCDEYADLLGALTGRSTADVLAELTGKGGTDA